MEGTTALPEIGSIVEDKTASCDYFINKLPHLNGTSAPAYQRRRFNDVYCLHGFLTITKITAYF